MKWSSGALFGLAATTFAAGKAPTSSSPDGCSASRSGKFQVSIAAVGNQKRSLEKRSCDDSSTLVMSLQDGVLTDAQGRTGSIVANFQFQFDNPPQENAIYTSGFSACNNGSLAIGGSTVFYKCLSGDFYNLYDRPWAAQCSPIELVIAPCDGSSPGGNGASGGGNTVGTSMVQTTIVTVISDGQPQVHTALVPIPMCQIGDGQVQVRTTPCASINPVSQIGDGQPQGPTGHPVSQIGDGQPQGPTGAPVTQISDGQPQAPSAPVVSQISDGQPQAPSAPVVSQISDGQPQAPSAPVVSQISDGQPQAPSAPVVSQISDGQPQAPIKTGPVVSQISDGQPQAPSVVPSSAANKYSPSFVAIAMVFGAVLCL